MILKDFMDILDILAECNHDVFCEIDRPSSSYRERWPNATWLLWCDECGCVTSVPKSWVVNGYVVIDD